MSYYRADYYRNIPPYDGSDRGAYVPGWGLAPRSAGAARVGIGDDAPTIDEAIDNPREAAADLDWRHAAAAALGFALGWVLKG